MSEPPRVFLSHSGRDKPLARRFDRRLRQCGVETFLDEAHLQPGVSLPDSIKRQIRGSNYLFVVWTVSAARSEWVARELEFAAQSEPGPAIIPLLFVPPAGNPIVADTLGIDFSVSHRFERAFERLAAASGFGGSGAADRRQLSDDLALTLRENPMLVPLFENAIDSEVSEDELVDAQFRQIVAPDDPAAAQVRRDVLDQAQDAFKRWKPDRVSVAGLPAAGRAEFHALDFALWSAAWIALLKTDDLRPLVAPEVEPYLGIFAKILGATGAGYEALIVLLRRFPGYAADAMREFMDAGAVRDGSIEAMVELFDEVFHLIARDSARDQFMPFSCAVAFFHHNHARLSEAQKRVFLRLVEVNGVGPWPGGPLDLLGALYIDPESRSEVVQRARYWIEHGYFDGTDVRRRREMPRLLYGFIHGLTGKGAPDADVRGLIEAAGIRIRNHFRSGSDDRVTSALRWIGHADRLPTSLRSWLSDSFQDGVYSSQFDSWKHAVVVGPLAGELTRAILQSDGTLGSDHHLFAIKASITARLEAAGLPDPQL